MRSFRFSIKDDLILEAGFSPIAYDEVRGYGRKSTEKYVYDDADNIIQRLALEYMVTRYEKDKKSKERGSRSFLRTFICLYHCKSLAATRLDLFDEEVNDEKAIKKHTATINKYKNKSLKIIKEALSDSEIRGLIIETIKKEYKREKNKKDSSME